MRENLKSINIHIYIWIGTKKGFHNQYQLMFFNISNHSLVKWFSLRHISLIENIHPYGMLDPRDCNAFDYLLSGWNIFEITVSILTNIWLKLARFGMEFLFSTWSKVYPRLCGQDLMSAQNNDFVANIEPLFQRNIAPD